MSSNSLLSTFKTNINLDYCKFKKPKVTGRFQDFMVTGELNTALGYMEQAIHEAEGLDDDKFSSLYRLWVNAHSVIKSVINSLEDDADVDGDVDDGDVDSDVEGDVNDSDVDDGDVADVDE